MEDVDAVVCTHCHHDHMASIFKFPGADLVMGEGELDFAKTAYGKGEIEAKVDLMGGLAEVPLDGDLSLMEGVRVVSTPGHTPGHVSVVCDLGDHRVVIAGDAAMTRA
jgi:N-acyl homoserine lactone hydrolase